MQGHQVSCVPSSLRRKLGLRPGDALDIRVEGGIVLTPHQKRLRKFKVIVDSTTGLPVLTADPDAFVLNSKRVQEILPDFP